MLYQVVFTGELRSDVNPEQAARDFAAIFKVPEEKAWRLVLSGRVHALKRDIDEANAVRYRDILDEIGLKVRLEPTGTPLLSGGPEAPAAPGSVPDAAGHGPMDGPPRGTDAMSGNAAVDTPIAPDGGSARADVGNPYAPPAADLTPAAAAGGIDAPTQGPIRVPAGHGWLWLKQGWLSYRAQPWTWIGAVLLVNLINMLVSLVPLVGGLATVIIGPVFMGGLMLGARAQERTGRFRASTVFDGFSNNTGQLALVGLFYFIGIFAIVMLVMLVALGAGLLSASAMEGLAANDPETAAAAAAVMGPGILLLVLVFMLAIVPLIMCYWFAPALVVFDGLSAASAMVASFRGCWLNILPFLVYGLAFLGLALILGLLLGLAAAVLGALADPLVAVAVLLALPLMLILASVVVASIHVGYRDIFHSPRTDTDAGRWVAQ
jgi:hypothetical protein